MAKDLKDAIERSQDTILADALGVAALFLLLLSGLLLPGLL